MKHDSTSIPCVFVSAYAVNPLKGSEDGMGWNFICQIARFQKVIAVTRKNNRPAIEQFQINHPENADLYANVEFLYYDWPQWMLFWKKGPVLSLIYYYFWQLGLALHFRNLRNQVDVVHNLNFHNDWTPTFLWLWSKPLVWGPVGHHPKIALGFLRPFYGFSDVLKDRFLWTLKWIFWNIDPFLFLSKWKADHVFCMHEEAAQKLRLNKKYSIMPSVASEMVEMGQGSDNFTVLSAGRFVALKGFDTTIRTFFEFQSRINPDERLNVKLKLVGTGPEKPRLQKLIQSLDLENQVEIIEWIPRAELLNLYSKASAFLFPSHEGAGMVVAEALSFGLPVLCWDNCGPGRFIHPDSQLRVEYRPGKPAELEFADKLGLLYQDNKFAANERKLARERYLNYFQWNLRGETLQKTYQEVLEKYAQAKPNSVLLQPKNASV